MYFEERLQPSHYDVDSDYATSGITETLPPAHQDHGQPRTNTYHHPEKLLQDHDSDDDEDPNQRATG